MSVYDQNSSKIFARHRPEFANQTVLLVGLGSKHTRDLESMLLPKDCDLCFSGIHALKRVVLMQISPCMIVSPLVGEDFDAHEIAALLEDIRYAGQYRAITPKIPKADLVLSELKEVAPGIDIDILELADTSFHGSTGHLKP